MFDKLFGKPNIAKQEQGANLDSQISNQTEALQNNLFKIQEKLKTLNAEEVEQKIYSFINERSKIKQNTQDRLEKLREDGNHDYNVGAQSGFTRIKGTDPAAKIGMIAGFVGTPAAIVLIDYICAQHGIDLKDMGKFAFLSVIPGAYVTMQLGELVGTGLNELRHSIGIRLEGLKEAMGNWFDQKVSEYKLDYSDIKKARTLESDYKGRLE